VKLKPLGKTIFLLILLPILLYAVKMVLDLRKGAAGTPANIVVDVKSTQGNIPSTLWQNLSQGGEEPVDMIKPVIPLIRALEPKLIRIDHIFDYFKVDIGNGNYDFSRLDQAVNSILLTGAKPMLSISYTTNEMAANGQNAGEPKDWNQWYQLVKATALHYSVDKKIDGIYYEVWNEPDLFGSWHYNSSPNYSTLYTQTAKAIVDGAGSSSYKIGGPAITAYYSNWIKSLFKTASQNQLRLDFISWHKYSKNIEDYNKDFEDLNKILSDYPQYFDIERLITEIGPNSEPDVWYDNKISGIHLISLSTRMAGKVHRLFTFEPVDGPTPRSNISSGWGLITHSTNGLKPKPRYYALQFLNKLQGQQLTSTGDGSWVSSLASRNGSTIQLLLVNYDQRQNHAETFPVTFQNLTPGAYTVKTTTYLGSSTAKKVTTTYNYRDQIYLDTNSAILIELTPSTSR
jgi:xylan 1,4-beta-xylosidase